MINTILLSLIIGLFIGYGYTTMKFYKSYGAYNRHLKIKNLHIDITSNKDDNKMYINIYKDGETWEKGDSIYFKDGKITSCVTSTGYHAFK